ncbi:hypothetical protein HN859_03455 [Candidatus Parcubacteria bacterium]|nr:hypothetical protein [Candidatus Parcubacteria bacterium]
MVVTSLPTGIIIMRTGGIPPYGGFYLASISMLGLGVFAIVHVCKMNNIVTARSNTFEISQTSGEE